MKTKEEYFQFEREKQKIFNKFYKDHNWPYKRIYGKENKKYDCLVKIGERWWKIEEKFRDKRYSDLLVEIIQDTETNSLGWIYTTEAEILIYGVENTLYWIDVKKLKEFVEKHKDKFNKVVSKKGWGNTENIIIPWYTIIGNNIGKLVR